MTTKSLKSSLKGIRLKAVNDMVLILEDPMDVMTDDESGITNDVKNAIKSGAIIIPEAYKDFAVKFPCRGRVISAGNQTKQIHTGDHVIFARMGCQRVKFNGEVVVVIREMDIHAIIEEDAELKPRS